MINLVTPIIAAAGYASVYLLLGGTLSVALMLFTIALVFEARFRPSPEGFQNN